MSETAVRDPEKTKEKTLTFSPKEIIDILSSDKFTKALTFAANETQASSREAGFSVDVTEGKTTHIGEVIAGNFTSMEDSMPIATIDGSRYTNFPNARLIDFHLHPDAIGSIMPSGSDLRIFSRAMTKRNLSAILAVGLAKNKVVEMLLLIPSFGAISKSDIQNYNLIRREDTITDQSPQEEIQRALNEVGIFSTMISYASKNKRFTPHNLTETVFIGAPPIKLSLPI